MFDPLVACEIVLVQSSGGRFWRAQALRRSDILNGRFPRLEAGCRDGYITASAVASPRHPPTGATDLCHSSTDECGTHSATDKYRTGQVGWILDDPDVQDQVIWMARRLRMRCRDDSSDLKDHEQDLRLYLIQQESKYDPTRGSVGAFVCVLLDSYVKMQIRSRLTRRRRGRLPLVRLSEDTDLDLRATPTSSWDSVELRDQLQTCLDRLSSDEISMLLLTANSGRLLASAVTNVSRRQIRNQLSLISQTCADLDSFSK